MVIVMTEPVGLPSYVRAQQKCVFLAVDGKKDTGAVFAEIEKGVNGPIAPHLAGVKFNDILHLPDKGKGLVKNFVGAYPHLKPFIPFIDLKAVDVWDTVANYMRKYYPACPELIVTLSIHCSVQVFNKMPAEFPLANVAVFVVGTDVTVDECIEMYEMEPAECALKWIGVKERYFDKWRIEGYAAYPDKPDHWPETIGQEHISAHAISSYEMLPMYRENFPWAGPIVPGIRDHWMLKGNQKRTAHTRAALQAGAQYLVLGGQATKGNPDAGIDPFESQRRTARQIRLGLGIGSSCDEAEELAELNAA